MFGVLTHVIVGIILYVTFFNVRKFGITIKEAFAIIAMSTIVSYVASIAFASFVVYALVSNCLNVVNLFFVAHIKVKIWQLSAVFAVFTTIISLLSANLTSALISIAHIISPEVIPIGRDALASNIILFVVHIIIHFVISFTISFKTGSLMHNRMLSYEDGLKRKLGTYLLYGAVITLGIFFFQTFIFYAIDDLAMLTLIFAIAMVIGFTYLVFAIFAFSDNTRMSVELRHKDETMKNLQLYTERLNEASMELVKFRHDHKNLMIPLRHLIEEKKWDDALMYFDGYMNEFTANINVIDIYIEKLNKVQIPEIKSILLDKCAKAQLQGTRVVVEVYDSVAISSKSVLIDVCRIIGIFMDNAVEACEGVDNTELRVYVSGKDDCALFVINNTCHTAPDINRIKEKGFSTKGIGRGIGLHTVEQILKKGTGIILNTKADDGAFTQELRVPQ